MYRTNVSFDNVGPVTQLVGKHGEVICVFYGLDQEDKAETVCNVLNAQYAASKALQEHLPC